MSSPDSDSRLERIKAAYGRRSAIYAPLDAWVCMVRQEKERALIDWLVHAGLGALDNLRLIEVGCGAGTGLLDFIRLGFAPRHLAGVDLIESRVDAARRLLPREVTLQCVDASGIAMRDGSFDIVYQSLMCSSILDDDLLAAVAHRMWSLARPGGGVLWYDFTYDNPRNRDVRGIPLRRVRELFPASGRATVRRVTLAPPIARAVTRMHPALYSVANALPLLRSHVLCWFPKPADSADQGPGLEG